jgi:dihydroorotase
MSIGVLNGKLIDEKNNPQVTNIWINGKMVTGLGYVPHDNEDEITEYDVKNGLILPQTFDFIYSPKISQLAACVRNAWDNGVLSMAMLPNTNGCLFDSPALIESAQKALGDLSSRVAVVGCASLNNDPYELSEISLLVAAGAKAIYFGRIIENNERFKQALTFVNLIGVPIIFGPITQLKKNKAHLNDGSISFEIGIRGESEHTEVAMVQSILESLSSQVTVPVHFQCLSSPLAVDIVEKFKAKGGIVTIGASPFHLVLSDHNLRQYPTELKFNPPFRSPESMQHLANGFAMGKVDHLTALHTPSQGDGQDQSFYDHNFGAETLSVYLKLATHCAIHHHQSLNRLSGMLSCPLNLFEPCRIRLNQPATFTVLNTAKKTGEDQRVLNQVELPLHGRLSLVVINGKVIYK